MKKITLFLASSAELKAEREQFEIDIYRKCKAWFDRGIFLHLDIWEDLSARMAAEGSQSEYNKKVQAADLFILLVYSKVGMYTGEEFEKAFGQFKATQKPFIFTYFKTPDGIVTDPSLAAFHQKLKDLKHFYCPFKDATTFGTSLTRNWTGWKWKDLKNLKERNQPSAIPDNYPECRENVITLKKLIKPTFPENLD